MRIQNVKAACKSGGKKPAISTEFDGQADDDSRESESTDEDGDDFQPIFRRMRLRGRALDPFIPSSRPLRARTMVVTQAPTELERLVREMIAFHKER
jgi:hypothetical protein